MAICRLVNDIIANILSHFACFAIAAKLTLVIFLTEASPPSIFLKTLIICVREC